MSTTQQPGMQKETRQITVTAYRDKAGNPCCAANFNTGEVCVFYDDIAFQTRTQRFGANETCVFAKQKLKKRKDGHGTLIPCSECPIWAWAE